MTFFGPLFSNCRKTFLAAFATAIIVALVGHLPAAPALGQNAFRIAAVVNDDVISVRDLDARVKMVIEISRLPKNRQTYQRVWPQVLRGLIDEKLKLQEASSLGIDVTDADLERAKRVTEKQNKLPAGSFERSLERQGIAVKTVTDQLRADIAWAKLVRRRFQGTVEVTIDEIDDALDRIERNRDAPQYRIREIVLTEDGAGGDAMEIASRLVQQLRGGAEFEIIAREFSEGATAATGGDIGWNTKDQLGGEIAGLIDGLEPGDISDPIRTIFGYQVIQLTDKRILTGANPLNATVSLKQVFVPLPAGADAAAASAVEGIARAVSETAQSCEDMDLLASELGSPAGTDLGTLKIGDLSPQMRDAVVDLKQGELSEPVRLPTGYSTIMVCLRQDPESDLPGREEITERLRAVKFETFAQRYLRDIRREAFIDTRL